MKQDEIEIETDSDIVAHFFHQMLEKCRKEFSDNTEDCDSYTAYISFRLSSAMLYQFLGPDKFNELILENNKSLTENFS